MIATHLAYGMRRQVISVEPTTKGTFNFTVKVIDADARTATKTFCINVN